MINLTYCLVGLDGGVNNLIMNYLDHMDTSDYHIKVIVQNSNSNLYKAEYERRGVEIIKIPSKKETIFGNYMGLRKNLKGSDIVHSHMTLTNCFPLFVAWTLGINNRISHSHLCEKKNLKTVVLSLLTRLFATDYWACGIDAGKFLYNKKNFLVLNNAIDLKKYKFNSDIREMERTNLDVSPGTLVVGHVGRFTKQKNHLFLLEVFKKIKQCKLDSILLLIGEGEDFQVVKEKVDELQLEKSVVCLNAINDVFNKLQAMDVFVLPSLYEGLPVSLIEAQANGLPCVMSNTITSEVVINDNVTQLDLVESVDNWVNKIMDYTEKGRVHNQENLMLAGYDINIEANKLNDLYHKMVDKC